MASARGWVDSDPKGVKDDIRRLGVAKAATYNMSILRERISDGETHWKGITRSEMLEALRELKESNPGRRNVGGKGVTLRNMASVTVKRLPGGAVAITGRKLAGGGRRANPKRRRR